jgi:hypothetical protein
LSQRTMIGVMLSRANGWPATNDLRRQRVPTRREHAAETARRWLLPQCGGAEAMILAPKRAAGPFLCRRAVVAGEARKSAPPSTRYADLSHQLLQNATLCRVCVAVCRSDARPASCPLPDRTCQERRSGGEGPEARPRRAGRSARRGRLLQPSTKNKQRKEKKRCSPSLAAILSACSRPPRGRGPRSSSTRSPSSTWTSSGTGGRSPARSGASGACRSSPGSTSPTAAAAGCGCRAPAPAWSTPSASTRRPTLLAALDQTASPEVEEAQAAMDGELEAWIAQLNQVARTAPANGHAAGAADGEDCVLYLLEPAQRVWRDTASVQPVAVSTVRARRLRGGAYGREHPLALSNLTGEDPPAYVAIDDQLIGRLLGGGVAHSKRLGVPGDGETLGPHARDRPLPLAQRPEPPADARASRAAAASAGASTARASSTSSASSRGPAAGHERQRQRRQRRRAHGRRRAWASPGTSTWTRRPAARSRPACRSGSPASCSRRRPCRPRSPASCARSSSRALRLPAARAAQAARAPGDQAGPRPPPALPPVTVSRGQGWKREEEEVELPLARICFDYAGAEVGWQDGRSS